MHWITVNLFSYYLPIWSFVLIIAINLIILNNKFRKVAQNNIILYSSNSEAYQQHAHYKECNFHVVIICALTAALSEYLWLMSSHVANEWDGEVGTSLQINVIMVLFNK